VWWPTRIEFSWPAQRTSLALDFGAVTFNPTIGDSLFALVPPAHSRVVAVEELEAP
jgi:outer membrane lipoprotein-sorting protein